MAGLPLDGVVTLVVHDVTESEYEHGFPTRDLWLHLLPKWPLLRRVQLGPPAARALIEVLLIDNGGREKPLLPSLTELVMVDFSLYLLSLLPLCNALEMRMEQGVPVEKLDLRLCRAHSDGRDEGWLQSLSKFVVNVLAPAESSEARQQRKSMWKTVACGPFVDNEDDLSDSEGWFSDNDDE